MLNVITSLKMGNKNIYWKGFEELNKDSEIVENLEQNEFVEKLPVGKEDKDVDNDGDHDKSDKYLLARRKKVSKIIGMSKKK